MDRNHHRVNPSEKHRIRAEIDEQIRDYLQRGGKIDIVTTSQRLHRNSIGSVWHTEDLPEISD